MTFPSDDDDEGTSQPRAAKGHHRRGAAGGGGSSSGGDEPRRRRPKFIRKVDCSVCGDTANDHIHYGAIACYSCRAFFRRAVTGATRYECAKSRNCEITKESRKTCQACRLKKCGEAGMKSSWVMTEEEKMDKKLRAVAKKSDSPGVKVKTPPAKKSDGGDVTDPPSGTLQSYMARRKMYLHRKRGKPTSTLSSSALSTTSDRDSPTPPPMSAANIKMEFDMMDMIDFDLEDPTLESIIKTEPNTVEELNDQNRRLSNAELMERLECMVNNRSNGANGGHSSSDDNNGPVETRTYTKQQMKQQQQQRHHRRRGQKSTPLPNLVRINSTISSLEASPLPVPSTSTFDSSDNGFNDQQHINNNYRLDNISRSTSLMAGRHNEVMNMEDESDDMIVTFSPLSGEAALKLNKSVSPSPSSVFSSSAGYPMSNETRVNYGNLSSRSPTMSPALSSNGFTFSNELRTEVTNGTKSFTPSPASFTLSSPASSVTPSSSQNTSVLAALINAPPSYHILGDDDFLMESSEQIQRQLKQQQQHQTSTEVGIYRRPDHRRELMVTTANELFSSYDDRSHTNSIVMTSIGASVGNNDLSLDIHDQTWSDVLSPPQLPSAAMHPIELTMPFTMEEDSELRRLVQFEKESREIIPVNKATMLGILESIQTGTPLKYEIARDGYITCVQRLHRFISKLSAFCAFDSNDRKALLRYNVHMAVNIKSARLLSPNNSLLKQIGFANNDNSPLPITLPSTRLEYHQVFRSPWCSGEDIEEMYRTMMEEIFKLEMDDITHVLLVASSLFATTPGSRVRERQLANRSQDCFIRMLYRYLCATIGTTKANDVLPKYRKMLDYLEKMADIMLVKRLPF